MTMPLPTVNRSGLGRRRFQWEAPRAPGIQDINATGVNLQDSYVQQWNVSLEKQIGANGFRLSYVGNSGIQLPYRRNLNQPLASTTPFSQDRRPYPLYRNITFVDSGGTQSFNAMQLEFTRRLTGGAYRQFALHLVQEPDRLT